MRKTFALSATDEQRCRAAAAAVGMMRAISGVTAAFDIGLDLPYRDELEIIGTAGRLVISDPWICRAESLALVRNGETELLPVDPDGVFGLTGEEADPYRIEFDAVSAAILAGRGQAFGIDDAVAQSEALDALRRSAAIGAPVRRASS